MMLTDERIAEIRARLEAATPGPWGPPRMIGARVAADFAAAAPADVTDLLQHADALAAENRRLRAALAEISCLRLDAMPDARETARRILADAFQHYARGPLNPVREAELRDSIATALREAEDAAIRTEREACAAVAEAATRMSYWSGFVQGGRAAARSIRARSAP